ncbi:MAG: STAS domain-containing protein [Lysobacter sp.]
MTTSVGPATVRRDGDALVFMGALDLAAVPSLWKACTPLLAGITRLELSAVEHVDSAGIALLAELAARTHGPVVDGSPAGLAELRRAYRLGPTLDFAT